MDRIFINGLCGNKMTDNQRKEAALFVSGRLDKLSVASFIVGLFQPEHMFGGLVGGTILFLAGISIKVRVTK